MATHFPHVLLPASLGKGTPSHQNAGTALRRRAGRGASHRWAGHRVAPRHSTAPPVRTPSGSPRASKHSHSRRDAAGGEPPPPPPRPPPDKGPHPHPHPGPAPLGYYSRRRRRRRRPGPAPVRDPPGPGLDLGLGLDLRPFWPRRPPPVPLLGPDRLRRGSVSPPGTPLDPSRSRLASVDGPGERRRAATPSGLARGAGLARGNPNWTPASPAPDSDRGGGPRVLRPPADSPGTIPQARSPPAPCASGPRHLPLHE